MEGEKNHIKLLKGGSYESFTHLYKQYVSNLYSFISTIASSETVTKDIVQETFLKVWVNRSKIDEKKSFKNFLFTIAKNQLLNELRRKINQTLSLDSNLEIEDDLYNDDSDELLLQIKKTKSKLPTRQLQLFEMNKEQGLTVKEIAEITNLSEQTIRNHLSLALKTIRGELTSSLIIIYLIINNHIL